MLNIRSDGVELHTITPNGAVSQPSFTTSMRGSLVAQWSMGLPRGFTHPALRQGALVEICWGPHVIWSGIMADPDRNSWEFTADGLHRLGERFSAVGTNSTRTIDQAIDDAIGRGLRWTRPVSISTTFSVTSGKVSEALDAYCETVGKQWMVTTLGQVIVYDLPTVCDWIISPDVPAMPTAGDDYTSTFFITYSSGRTSVSDPAAAERWGPAEEDLDLSNLGLSASQAIGDAVLESGSARPAFTDGVEVQRYQITNPGSVSPELWQITAGVQRVAHHGTLTSDGAISLGPLEWVIGATSYTGGEDTISLTPMGRLPRTQAEVAAQQAARLAGLEAAS